MVMFNSELLNHQRVNDFNEEFTARNKLLQIYKFFDHQKLGLAMGRLKT